jgi:hypothetical protein
VLLDRTGPGGRTPVPVHLRRCCVVQQAPIGIQRRRRRPRGARRTPRPAALPTRARCR